MGKYFLENVRAAYPEARCAIVVGSRGEMIRDAFAAYPWIEVIEANRRSPHALLSLLRRFKNSDLVVTPYTGGVLNASTKIVARLLARRGALVGYADSSPLNRFLFDHTLPTHGRSGVPRLHECAALETAHIPVATEQVTFAYLPQPGLLEKYGLQKHSYIVVGLFSGSDARGLSPERQQDLIDAIAHAFPATRLVFIGTTREQDKLRKLKLPSDSLVPATTVQEVSALIDGSAGMISLGTGTSHLAAHLRVPLVVLVACQGRQWVGQDQFGDAPIRVHCKPDACPPSGHDYSSYAPCINAINMDEVAASASALFKNFLPDKQVFSRSPAKSRLMLQ